MNQFSNNDFIVQGREATTMSFMNQVYAWMCSGLLLTAIVAWFTSQNPTVLNIIVSKPFVFWGIAILQLGLVITLSAAINKISAGVATTLFMLYSVLNGLTFSFIFLAYTSASIASTFLIAAGMFAALSIFGFTTKRDLGPIGRFLFMGLIGIIIASVVNIFLRNDMMTTIISYLGVFIFAGLTAHDTQKLKEMGEQIPIDDQSIVRKMAIIGGLTLYLDFINLFLYLLRIFGSER